MGLRKHIQSIWQGEGGARHTLSVAMPLILSASSYTLMNFIDRKFLFAYSTDAFAAAAPAGMTCFVFIALFMGTGGYVTTFVAQYIGAGRPHRVGASIWQGIYFVLLAWLAILPLTLLAPAFFGAIGHSPAIMEGEIIYFKIMAYGAGFTLLNVVFSSFYSGLEKNWTVMWVRFLALFINIPLNYGMIFGKFGFPEMGIAGAAWATVISTAVGTVCFIFLLFTPTHERLYGMIRQWRPEPEIFRRLIRYGFPNGIQFMMDMMGFTIFLLFIGQLGDLELTASNAAWTLNVVVYMPMVGFAIALSAIVGQQIGKGAIPIAQKATRNVAIMVFGYMAFIAFLFVAIPRPLLILLLENRPNDPNFEEIMDLSVMLMRIVAIYSLFDAISLVYSSAIKGAGDTRFVMWVTLAMSGGVLILPSYLICSQWRTRDSVLYAWGFAGLYIASMAVIFFLRYRAGHWKSMQVIEKADPASLSDLQPAAEIS